MKEEIQLKDIACYLPYGLKAMWTNKDDNSDSSYYGKKLQITPLQSHLPVKYEQCKIILRPLSDLYKPCLEGGKIPIVELAKIACCDMSSIVNTDRCFINSIQEFLRIDRQYDFSIVNGCYIELYDIEDEICLEINQFELFQKLYEWHFDINGLIEKNLAIDINTIEL